MTRREWGWLAVLVLLGLAMRLGVAWAFQWSANSDAGICVLMTKHMTEGLDWPVFFYGQPYMGNVEPFVSMLFCKALGWSVFHAHLGTVLIGLGVLPVVYLWARRLGGVWAGRMATILCLVGPLGFAHYMASPRGGYALQMTFTSAILAWTSWLAEREWVRRPPSWGHYVGVGILAGLAWWTSQLSVTGLLTAALVFLPALLRPNVWRRIPLVFMAFGLGSLPWWLWNATHQWATLGFSGSMGRVSWLRGMNILLTERLPDLLDTTSIPVGLGAGVLAIYALAWGWMVVRTFWRPATTPAGEASCYAFLWVPLWLYPLLHLVVSASSHFVTFSTSRYLLPLFPVLAVAVGVGLVTLGIRRVGRVIAFGLLVLLLATQLRWLIPISQMARDTRPRYETVQRTIVPALRQAGVEALYAEYGAHWMNAASGEACVWTDPLEERYMPYEKRAEITDRLGLWNGGGTAAEFVRLSGGSMRTVTVEGGSSFCCDLQPPAPHAAELAPALWTGAYVTGQTGNVARLLTDRSLITACKAPSNPSAPYVLTVELARTQTVCGVRWINTAGEYPPWWRVETQTAAGTWRALTADITCEGFFWSGPRLYWGRNGFQARAGFPSTATRHLRLVFGRNNHLWQNNPCIAELSLLTSSTTRVKETNGEVIQLCAQLRSQNIRRLYCGRWLANKVAEATDGHVWTPREAGVWDRHTIQDLPGSRDPRYQPVRLDAGTAFAVSEEDAPSLQEAFAALGLSLEHESVGPWTLFHTTASLTAAERARTEKNLVWWGTTVLMDQPDPQLAGPLQTLPSESATTPEEVTRREAWLQRSLMRFPDHPALLSALARLYRDSGDVTNATHYEQWYHELVTPACPLSVRYYGGLTLLGVTAQGLQGIPGDVVRLRLFWQMPQVADPRPTVFVHARDGAQTKFQFDVAIMEGMSPGQLDMRRGFPISQELALRIPPDLPAGHYTLHLGVVEPGGDERWKPITDLPVQRRAVQLPMNVEVTLPLAGSR